MYTRTYAYERVYVYHNYTYMYIHVDVNVSAYVYLYVNVYVRWNADFRASGQFGTGMKKTNNTGTVVVPD
jgi:hypothetical protein